MKLALARTANSNIDVHKDGCSDLRKPKYVGYDDGPYVEDFESEQEVCEFWFSDFIGNEAEGNGDVTWQETYESWDIKFLPCTKGLPHETPVTV